MLKYMKHSLRLTLALAPFLPLSLVFPKNRPAPGRLNRSQPNPDQAILGRWNFHAVTTEGVSKGTVWGGEFGLNGTTFEGWLAQPEQPGLRIKGNQKGPIVTLAIEGSLNASGQFRDNDIMTGAFTGPNGVRGQWVASRGPESTTKISGQFNFEADLGGQKISGLLELEQGQNSRFNKVLPEVSGTLAVISGPAWKVQGAASGGEVYLIFEDGNRRLFGYDTTLSEISMSGILYRADGTEQGSWKASLIEKLPDLANEWGFGTISSRGTHTRGSLKLSQDASGNLSGTFTPKDGSTAAVAVTGRVEVKGRVTLTVQGLQCQGEFDFAMGKTVSGTFSDPTSGTSGKWGMTVQDGSD